MKEKYIKQKYYYSSTNLRFIFLNEKLSLRLQKSNYFLHKFTKSDFCDTKQYIIIHSFKILVLILICLKECQKK